MKTFMSDRTARIQGGHDPNGVPMFLGVPRATLAVAEARRILAETGSLHAEHVSVRLFAPQSAIAQALRRDLRAFIDAPIPE